MTIEQVLDRIKELEGRLDDDEKAHAYEDKFHHDVLKAIAAGAENAQELAGLALKTLELKFERWCA